MGHLLLRKASQMLQHLQCHQGVIPGLIRHIYDTSICEVVLRLVCSDDMGNSNMEMGGGHLNWLCETELLDCLLDRLTDSANVDAQISAAQILVAVIRTQPSSLAMRLSNSKYLDKLVDQVKRCVEGEVSIPLLNVCIAAMDPRRRMADGFGMLIGPMGIQGEDQSANIFSDLIRKLAGAVPALLKYLQGGGLRGQQLMPYGVLDPPVGIGRLKITEMFSVLMYSRNEEALKALVDSEAILKCLVLFLKYPFNNLLHRNVAVLVAAAVDSESPEVLEHLFSHGCFLDWLVSVPDRVLIVRPQKETSAPVRYDEEKRISGTGITLGVSVPVLGSSKVAATDNSGAEDTVPNTTGLKGAPNNSKGDQPSADGIHENDIEKKIHMNEACIEEIAASHSHKPMQDPRVGMEQSLRPGYIGHVTQMANHVLMIAERDEWVGAALKEHKNWNGYVATVLAERNSQEDVSKWECGRPSPGMLRPASPPTDSGNILSGTSMSGGESYRYPIEEDDDDLNGPFGSMDGLTVSGGESTSTAFGQLNIHDSVPNWEDLTSSSSSSSSSSESSGSSASAGASDSDEGSPKHIENLKGDGGPVVSTNSGGASSLQINDEVLSYDSSDDDEVYVRLPNGFPTMESGQEEALDVISDNVSKMGFFESDPPPNWVAFESDNKETIEDSNHLSAVRSRPAEELPLKGDFGTFSFWQASTSAFKVPDDL